MDKKQREAAKDARDLAKMRREQAEAQGRADIAEAQAAQEQAIQRQLDEG